MSEVSTKHPDYIDRAEEWKLCRDAARGEQAMKGRGQEYLPMPSGFRQADDKGVAAYAAYLKRAQVPEIMTPTLNGMVGVIHHNEFKIDMPESMQGLWERSTKDGLPLEALHRRITRELLLTGRYALLPDAPEEGADLPYFSGYAAEALINWSNEHDFYVLDESGPVRDGFIWKEEARHLVLEKVDGKYVVKKYVDGTESETIEPQAKGGKALEEIPLVVIGAQDVNVTPDDPPLLGVARSVLSIFQLSADYRHQLYCTGQETLVVINGDAPEFVGSGACIVLNGDVDNPTSRPDAKYIGPQGTGIEAHKNAMDDEKQAAVAAGARLFDSEKKTAESGEALGIRFTAQTASLSSVAKASAAGLEKGLRNIAIMMGEDPQSVTVTPPKKLIDVTLTAAEAAALMKLWQDGAISFETLYENLQRGQIASAERDHKEERDLIDEEDVARAKIDQEIREESGLLPPPINAPLGDTPAPVPAPRQIAA